jgi:transglutaminase-like putative cysteine protease
VRILVEGMVARPARCRRPPAREGGQPVAADLHRADAPDPADAGAGRHRRALPSPARGSGPHQRPLELAAHIFGAVEYQSGATSVASTAGDAILLGAGVCQDHAHVFLACCHARGIPARYVSGYIDPESTGHAASHAWVDVWVEDKDYTGWVSIDVTHNRLMSEAYCRLAIGRDYESAAPVRGMRRGGGEETMTVQALIVPVQ